MNSRRTVPPATERAATGISLQVNGARSGCRLCRRRAASIAWRRASRTRREGRPAQMVDFGSRQPPSPPNASCAEIRIRHRIASRQQIVRRSTPRNLPQLAQDVVDARRGVLALKLGQVLEQQVLKLSVGTSEIQENVEAVVSRAIERKTQGILFAGAWGSGKTHLLTMLNAVAVKQGMATSSVILDGEGVRLSDPMALMEAFLHSLRYPGESVPCGIGPRLRQLRHTGIHWTPAQAGERRILDAIRTVPADAFDEPGALQVLEDYFTFSLAATQANRKLSLDVTNEHNLGFLHRHYIRVG